ncbi:MAG: hypothetical protein QM770_03155 [Tepidisphaeraceae bacterium]
MHLESPSGNFKCNVWGRDVSLPSAPSEIRVRKSTTGSIISVEFAYDGYRAVVSTGEHEYGFAEEGTIEGGAGAIRDALTNSGMTKVDAERVVSEGMKRWRNLSEEQKCRLYVTADEAVEIASDDADFVPYAMAMLARLVGSSWNGVTFGRAGSVTWIAMNANNDIPTNYIEGFDASGRHLWTVFLKDSRSPMNDQKPIVFVDGAQ